MLTSKGGRYGRNKWTGTEVDRQAVARFDPRGEADTERATLQLLRKHGWNIGGNHNMGSRCDDDRFGTLADAEKTTGNQSA